jgi:large subunit ribosomal protein L3
MIRGLIGRKIGMTQVFTEGGTVEPVTAIEAGPCVVTQIRTHAKEGYSAVQLGFSEAKKLNAPERGHLGKLGLFRHLREFRVADTSGIELGNRVDVSLFQPGDTVEVSGISKGRGFAGGVKRYHFGGGSRLCGLRHGPRACSEGAEDGGTHGEPASDGEASAGRQSGPRSQSSPRQGSGARGQERTAGDSEDRGERTGEGPGIRRHVAGPSIQHGRTGSGPDRNR